MVLAVDLSMLYHLFSPVHQAIIGVGGAKIVFANPSARAAFGSDICNKPVSNIFPEEIFDGQGEKYICAANVLGCDVGISVVKMGEITLLFIDFMDAEDKPALYLTRQMMKTLRTNVMGIKMSADRCFLPMDEGVKPGEKYVSMLYHYYYRLVHTLTQMDSADLLGRRDLAFVPAATDLVELCSDLTAAVSDLFRDSGVKIKFSSPVQESKIIAVVDSEKIVQMLLALFSNSIRHTGRGGSISLSIKRAENRLVISVDDDGTGIPQDVLSSIFVLPQPEDFDLQNAHDGLGLGLYVSFGIVQLHNGVMLVESREGEGTRVRVMLPVDTDTTPKFKSPEIGYRHNIAHTVLSGLANELDSRNFGPKFED